MAYAKIKDILNVRIGLHADSIGDSSIERAISHRMRAIGVSRMSGYLERLGKDDNELDELVEEVVVPETWFFRNNVPFKTMVDCVLELRFIRAHKVHDILKILSIPCSTGEEPYSISMSLIDGGLTAGEFKIDAVDISKRALTKARRGIYGRHSFRENDLTFRDKYFRRSRSGYHLSQEIKDTVEFKRANIVRDILCSDSAQYDIIFCRNLLIYFERNKQREILGKLHRCLKENGVLFVGHAEMSQVDNRLFSKINVARSFAYRKIHSMGKEQENTSVFGRVSSVEKLQNIYAQLVEVTKKDVELARNIDRNKLKKSKIADNMRSKVAGDGNVWFQVEKLIDQGRLSAASELCEILLNKYPESADGYYYLGLISNLEGSAGSAEALLKKAIYLNPQHYKALALSAHVAEKRGDDVLAKALRRREQRARSKK
jgi:chemotaxis protein methyltransferase WspC